ncbi:MAG: hypothetical protein JNL38_26265 [Myxococcales bacterium]|jgi:hypothetical protein|nr:hypothetical protein [Myxococcales bacterium]
MRTVLVSCVALVVIVGCSSTPDRPSPINAAGTPGAGGTVDPSASDAGDAGDASVSDGSAGCLTGAYDLDLFANAGGSRAIAGKIVLPNVVDANRNGLLTISTSTATLSQPLPFKTVRAADSLTFRVSGLAPNKYVIRVQIDQAGTSSVDETGDIDGFFGGSPSAPILTRQDAISIDVTNDCRSGSDFGAGIKL